MTRAPSFSTVLEPLPFRIRSLPPRHSASIPPGKPHPAIVFSRLSTRPKWNTNNNLIVTHPVLVLLESCTSMVELKQIQAHMTRTGLMTTRFPASRVVAFCAISDDGDMDHARLVFEGIMEPNTYIWNTMIRGYVKRNRLGLAFSCLLQMVRGRRVEMDQRSFVFGLKAAELFERACLGEEIHGLVCKMGFDCELLVRNALMHFYVKHNQLDTARKLFDGSPEKDVVSWTTMIDGYARMDIASTAMVMFSLMLSESVEPNEVTMIAVLSACSKIGVSRFARSVHGFIQKRSFNFTKVSLVNSLIDVYCKCGQVEMAKKVFDNVELRDVFSWTTMIDGYAKSGNIEQAKMLFDEMPRRNVVSWTAMISGYVYSHQPEAALELFQKMILDNVKPVDATFPIVLSACAQSGHLDLGESIYHQFIIQDRMILSTMVANAFVNMYSKCGAIDKAEDLFAKIPEKDIVSWNTMILGYALHGCSKKALSLLNEMNNVGIKPDGITFVGVLSACCHGGLVAEGRRHFDSMRRVFNISPTTEHYACMINLFGRVGHLEEAGKLITNMPMEPDKESWGALLSACRMHNNVEVGNLAAQKLLNLDSGDSGTYSIMSNIFADANKWSEVMTTRKMMREVGVKKIPGYSSIKVNGQLQVFFASDRSHPMSKKLCLFLDEVYLQMKVR